MTNRDELRELIEDVVPAHLQDKALALLEATLEERERLARIDELVRAVGGIAKDGVALKPYGYTSKRSEELQKEEQL